MAMIHIERLTDVKRAESKERSAQFGQLISVLEKWDIPEDALDRVHDAARASLNEVKSLTEYEDGKVSRLLTVIAFLSAVVAAAFARFASDYAWPKLGSYCTDLGWWLPFGTYIAFFVYILLVTGATLKLLNAIRPTFNLPASWKPNGRAGAPTSMLFYKGILDVTAPHWAETFVQQTEPKAIKLKASYAKCYIGEAYLVAEKVAEKLRIAAPGVTALLWSLRVLLAFFVLLALTILAVAPTRH